MEKLVPKDHGETIAVFRSQVVGPLLHRSFTHGELRAAIEELSRQTFRPPDSARTRTYSVPTLERWYYAFRKGGLEALVPRPRSDRGRARALDEEMRRLVCDIRGEFPSASARLILTKLEQRGRIARGTVSEPTVRRLLAERGLPRLTRRRVAPDAAVRRRWEASHAGALWHGDVCHGPVLTGGGVRTPLRIHGMLDDRSRCVVALEARTAEREEDMLAVFVASLRRHGRPDVLYLDNGSTYSGKVLATACARLGIGLVHAKPHDPQARGKMERFFRTLREGLLDHMHHSLTLAEVQRRLDAFVRDYNGRAHASLFGDTPEMAWRDREVREVSEGDLGDALTVRERRLVSRDGVVTLGGRLFELQQGFLAGKRVSVAHCLVGGLAPAAYVEHDGRRYDLRPLDRGLNGRTRRPARQAPPDRPSTGIDLTEPAEVRVWSPNGPDDDRSPF